MILPVAMTPGAIQLAVTRIVFTPFYGPQRWPVSAPRARSSTR
jgi:hypothetical protein